MNQEIRKRRASYLHQNQQQQHSPTHNFNQRSLTYTSCASNSVVNPFHCLHQTNQCHQNQSQIIHSQSNYNNSSNNNSLQFSQATVNCSSCATSFEHSSPFHCPSHFSLNEPLLSSPSSTSSFSSSISSSVNQMNASTDLKLNGENIELYTTPIPSLFPIKQTMLKSSSLSPPMSKTLTTLTTSNENKIEISSISYTAVTINSNSNNNHNNNNNNLSKEISNTSSNRILLNYNQNNVEFTKDQMACVCKYLLQENNLNKLDRFISRLPEYSYTESRASNNNNNCQQLSTTVFKDEPETVVHARALVAYHKNEFKRLYTLLESRTFAPESHVELQKLWYNARYKESEFARKKTLGAVDKYRIRKKFPLPRTIWDGLETIYTFKENARRILRNCFKENPYPSLEDKKKLSLQTKLTMTQISNWFKNRRQRNRTPNPNESSSSLNSCQLETTNSSSHYYLYDDAAM